jgi:hypothetical protein
MLRKVLNCWKFKLKFACFLLPLSIYLLCFTFYVPLYKLLFLIEIPTCKVKNIIVQADEFIFKNSIYEFVNTSENIALLLLFSIPYLTHFVNPLIYIAYLAVRQKGWNQFWLFILSFGLTCAMGISIQFFLPTSPPWIYLDLPS